MYQLKTQMQVKKALAAVIATKRHCEGPGLEGRVRSFGGEKSCVLEPKPLGKPRQRNVGLGEMEF